MFLFTRTLAHVDFSSQLNPVNAAESLLMPDSPWCVDSPFHSLIIRSVVSVNRLSPLSRRCLGEDWTLASFSAIRDLFVIGLSFLQLKVRAKLQYPRP